MIAQHVLAILWLVLVGVTYTRLLHKREGEGERFRALVAVSGICLTVAAIIFWLGAFESYATWFVPVVYPILDWVRITLVIGGGALILWAFIQRVENSEPPILETNIASVGAAQSEIAIPRTGLASLNALRVSLSQPYPFVELARVALSGVSEVVGMSHGALYVYNESTQEMSIASSQGLTPEQERAIERLSTHSPILAEVLSGGEPLISADFVPFVCGSQLAVANHPGSYAVLAPLLRNNEPLGLIALFVEAPPNLSNSALSLVSQMSDIVADKFVNVKLRGELARLKKKGAERDESRKRMTLTFQRAFEALSSGDGLSAVCQELVGLGSADSVALIEFDDSQDGLRISACSGNFPETSAGFQSAALQALERQTLVLLSRERRRNGATASVPETEREPMALVAPFASVMSPQSESAQNASDSKSGILFWNSKGRFFLAPEELHEFQEWLQPLKVSLQSILQEKQSHGLSGTLEIVREILRPEQEAATEKARLKQFMTTVRSAFGLSGACLVFKRTTSGQLRPLMTLGVAFESVEQLVILPGEGSLGRCGALGGHELVKGEGALAHAADEYDMLNRDVFGQQFTHMGSVQAQLITPIVVNDATRYVVSFYFSDVAQAEECSKALLPLCQLLAFVLSVKELQTTPGTTLLTANRLADSFSEEHESAAAVINEINNDLATIIGNCQLVSEDPNLSGAVERVLRLVIERAEHSAQKLRAETNLATTETVEPNDLSETKSSNSISAKSTLEKVSLAEELRSFASQRVVGGQILLTEGKAREVEFDLESDFVISIPAAEAERLIEQLCHGLSAQADEREIVTVSLYHDGGFDYLDISRRWRNLPAVKRIGSYARFDATLEDKIFDISHETLDSLADLGVELAVDRRSQRPAYVTMRIPTGADVRSSAIREVNNRRKLQPTAPRILAIDDQTMILDLLSAMCDSLGFRIDTFDSPLRAIAAFERGMHEIVITDVAMPQLDGWEVAAAIKKLKPDTYLIFITGWQEGLSAERLQEYDINQVLKKPFRLEQLTAALQEAQRLSSSAPAN